MTDRLAAQLELVEKSLLDAARMVADVKGNEVRERLKYDA